MPKKFRSPPPPPANWNVLDYIQPLGPINPKDYYDTSGEAVWKAETLLNHIEQYIWEHEPDPTYPTILQQGENWLAMLIAQRGKHTWLEYVPGEGYMPKDPRGYEKRCQ